MFILHVNTCGWANAKTLDKRQTRAVVREGAPRRQWLQYLTHYLVSSGHEPRVGGGSTKWAECQLWCNLDLDLRSS